MHVTLTRFCVGPVGWGVPGSVPRKKEGGGGGLLINNQELD